MLLLEITMSDGSAWVLAIIVIAALVLLIRSNTKLSDRVIELNGDSYMAVSKANAIQKDYEQKSIRLDLEHRNRLKDLEIANQKSLRENESLIRLQHEKLLAERIERFKAQETARIKQSALAEAEIKLKEWKHENTLKIRSAALAKSSEVTLGKVTEHLIPFIPNFPFNFKDARFIGSPIDLIVFDGHSEGEEDISIYIIEVKTGNSKLTAKQKRIKEAVRNKQVYWEELNLQSLPPVEGELF